VVVAVVAVVAVVVVVVEIKNSIPFKATMMKLYDKFIVFSLIILMLLAYIACQNKNETKRYKYDPFMRKPPPSVDLSINTSKYCEEIHNTKFINKNLYIIYDSVDNQTRMIFEQILKEKYGFLVRRTIDSVDIYCVKPFTDSIIKKLTGENIEQIVDKINIEVAKLEDSIGIYKIKKDVYIVANKLPRYKNDANEGLFVDD